MKLVGMMPVRNEAWIVGLSLRVALMWCDEMVVLNHASTDGTADILAQIEYEHPGRVFVITEHGGREWPEMEHRQRLLESARQKNATHVAIVDADEVLTGNLLSSVRDLIASLGSGWLLQMGMPCIWRALNQYRTDGIVWSHRWDLTLAFRDVPELCWRSNGYDHHHREPFNARMVRRGYDLNGGVMHLQWASWRRLVAKQSWYQMLERLKYPDKSTNEIVRLYGQAVDEQGLALKDTPEEWWAPYRHLLKYVDLDLTPWHEGEIERLIGQHGQQVFEDLNIPLIARGFVG